MRAREVQLSLGGLFLVAMLLRLAALRLGPALYPDAYFQYLEPAWARVAGTAMLTWEWYQGIRSWVLPGYHGGWMALLRELGMTGPAIGLCLQLHWAVVSLALVWSAWRAGCFIARKSRRAPSARADESGWEGGLVAAAFVATSPVLALYSVETLSELPSMIGLVVALTLTAELTEGSSRSFGWRRPALIGLIASFASCVRIVNAPFVLVIVVWLLASGRHRALLPLTLGALLPIALFGAVDELTWGEYFYSFRQYLSFNLFSDGAEATFGTSPADWLVDHLWNSGQYALTILVVLALSGLPATAPWLLAASGMLLLFSCQAHKEQRFVLIVWPLLLTAAGGALGAWASRARAVATSHAWWRGRRGRAALAALLVSCSSADHLRGLVSGELDYGDGLPRERFAAQSWVGQQRDCAGLLIEGALASGGYLWFGSSVPQVEARPELLANPLFNYLLLRVGSPFTDAALQRGFEIVRELQQVLVLKRRAH